MMCQGHDVVILEDLIGTEWRPPVMWVEWFREYMFLKPEERLLEVSSNIIGFLGVRNLEEQEQLTFLFSG